MLMVSMYLVHIEYTNLQKHASKGIIFIIIIIIIILVPTSSFFIIITNINFRSLKDGTYYDVKDVIFFLENFEGSLADYRRKAVEKRVKAVIQQDSDNLKNYLTGVIDTCPQIDLNKIVPIDANNSIGNSIESVSKDVGLSLEQLQQQRERHAAMLDQSIGNSDENKQKRKAISSEGDATFLQADSNILKQLRAEEVPAHTRTTVLRAPPGRDFSFVTKLLEQQKKESEKKDGQHSKTSTSAKSNTLSKAEEIAKLNSTSAPPIIIVPSAITSLITTLNAIDFLEKSNYISLEQKQKDGIVRESSVSLRRKIQGEEKKYFTYTIMDNPAKLTPQDWNRVVAVFVTGQAWQFKGWPEGYSDPVKLFQKVSGIHLTWDDRPMNPTVSSWNCKILKINQFKRHLDAGAANEFWATLDKFVYLNKPELRCC